MDIIVSGLEIDLFEKGKTIYKKGQPSENVYIIFSGLIGIFDNEDVIDYLSRGEIFGITSLFGNMLNWTASAVEDTVCYAVANREFKTILDSNERFASFFSSLLNRRFRSFKAIASDKKIIEEATFVLEVEKIIYKHPVICSPELTIAGASSEMEKNAVSSIVVADSNVINYR